MKTVIIPVGITGTSSAEDRQRVAAASEAMFQTLKAAGIRVHIDDRDNYTSAWKFNHWELKGCQFAVETRQKTHFLLSQVSRSALRSDLAIWPINRSFMRAVTMAPRPA